MAGDLLFDYSKTTMSAADRDLLIGMYEEAQVPARREAMFSGQPINETEGRAVLHTALRNLDGGPVTVQGMDVMGGVRDTLDLDAELICAALCNLRCLCRCADGRAPRLRRQRVIERGAAPSRRIGIPCP